MEIIADHKLNLITNLEFYLDDNKLFRIDVRLGESTSFFGKLRKKKNYNWVYTSITIITFVRKHTN